MRKILDRVVVKAGRNCFYSCLYNLSLYYGYNLNEEDIFFLCSGLTCSYTEKMDKKFAADNLEFIPYDEQAIRFAKEINRPINVAHDKSMEENRKAIQTGFMANQPIIVMVEPRVLSYHPLDENIENSCHCIFIYGLDEEKGQAYIGDTFVVDSKGNVTAFNGRYSIEEILRGMVGYAWFSESAESKPVGTKYIRKRIIEELHCYTADTCNPEKIGGIEAWKLCVKQFGKYTGEQKDFLDYIYHFQVRIPFVYKYLIQILEREKENLDKKEELVLELKMLEEHWNAFIIKILMASQAVSEKAEGRVIEKGMTILEEQKLVFRHIESYLQTIE